MAKIKFELNDKKHQAAYLHDVVSGYGMREDTTDKVVEHFRAHNTNDSDNLVLIVDGELRLRYDSGVCEVGVSVEDLKRLIKEYEKECPCP